MGFKAYLGPAFNKLDFFIVVTSALDMAGVDEGLLRFSRPHSHLY